MIDRRQFIVVLGATGLLSACQSGPPKASAITVKVTVLVMRLRSTGKFDSADYFALQGNAASALGSDLIGSDQIAVGPGKTVSKIITVEPDATALAFVALIREPGGKNWRTSRPVSPGSQFTVNVTLGSGGISS
jgi:type VI secretion system protein VasD